MSLSASEYGRVAVLYGGNSAEREISIASGTAVLAALQRSGVDAVGVDYHGDPVGILEAEAQHIWIALHGRGGEDGSLQGLLEHFGLPYTGSGVLASALSMDKLRTKRVWQGAGLATPDYVQWSVSDQGAKVSSKDVDAIVKRLGLPLFVKPACEGSSVGMSRVNEADELSVAIQTAQQYDNDILIEQFMAGDEYTVAVLDGRALPVIRIATPNAFYDFTAKYKSDNTEYHIPCGLSEAEEKKMQKLAVDAFAAVGGKGWGRVDVISDANGKHNLIEVNTVPGMTDHSLVPMAANAVGIDFDALVLRILALSVEEK